ncbi:MAG: hypothetical protein FWG38_08935, partial [Defluviitaleaceae bacterium]|nr:hypothetical protein [Defluviitaleaceae bacterium]
LDPLASYACWPSHICFANIGRVAHCLRSANYVGVYRVTCRLRGTGYAGVDPKPAQGISSLDPLASYACWPGGLPLARHRLCRSKPFH